MGRHILAIVAGLVSGTIVIAVVQFLSHLVYPLPEGLSIEDAEALGKHIAGQPIGAFLLILVSYGLGAFVAGVVATYLSRPYGRVLAILSGVILTLFGLLNLLFIPHPLWFWAASLSVFIPMALLGYLFMRSRIAG